MKTRTGSCATTPQTMTPSFYTYLRPGALAQLRNSKITARSKQNGARTLHALTQLEPSLDSAIPVNLGMGGTPSFNQRVSNHPRCLHRRKLIAAKPSFSQAQS